MREIPIDGEVKRVVNIGNAALALAFKSGAFQIFDTQSFVFTSSVMFEETKNGINDIFSINPNEFLLATVNGILHTTRMGVIKHCRQELNKISSISNIRDAIYFLGGSILTVWDQIND